MKNKLPQIDTENTVRISGTFGKDPFEKSVRSRSRLGETGTKTGVDEKACYQPS